jgi:hypothetical protein
MSRRVERRARRLLAAIAAGGLAAGLCAAVSGPAAAVSGPAAAASGPATAASGPAAAVSGPAVAAMHLKISFPGVAAAARIARAPLSVRSAAALAAARAALKNVRVESPGLSSHSDAGRLSTIQPATARGLLPNTYADVIQGENVAGWWDDNSQGNSYSTVAGEWVQPAINCYGVYFAMAAFWVGLDLSPTEEQAGTLTECFFGLAYYMTFYEMLPGPVQVQGDTVSPGDFIGAEVNDNGGGVYGLLVEDFSNQANSFSTNQNCPSYCADANAEWLAEAPLNGSGIDALADYGTWTVSWSAVVSGYQGVISSFPDDIVYAVNPSTGDVLEAPGGLSNGDSFTDFWENSS